MVPSPTPPTPCRPHAAAGAPLSILRTETVLSRLPIHNLTTGGPVTIRITRTNAQGALDLRWAVSYNAYYGPPRHLAYKLDTIVINQLLDAVPRPLPRVLKLGSLRQIGMLLDVQVSGRQYAHLKSALHQNASAYIVAYLRYRGRDGRERTLNTGFTRYSVIFTGESLPDGTQADAVYLVLSEPYLDLLNHAPVRPLDYAYLKVLTPTAQRFYELLSYKMFAVLKYRYPQATLRYADYCLLSTQQRYTRFDQVKKQMYKVHQPHLTAGYVVQVRYEATTDVDGQPDWLLHYTPGPKARAEYAAFTHQPGAEAAAARTLPADADPQDLLASVTRDPPAAPVAVADPAPLPATPRDTPGTAAPETEVRLVQAHALVTAFYQRFYGLTQVIPLPKELEHATALLAQHGAAKAHFLLAFAQQAAAETHYQPQVLGGILHYLPRALAAYDAQAARAIQAATQRAAADERTWHERYLEWRQGEIRRLRAALPPAELAALEATARARLVAAGTVPCTLEFSVRFAVEEVLDAQAGLLSFAAWRQTQEGCR